jgi:hypothetical protein
MRVCGGDASVVVRRTGSIQDGRGVDDSDVVPLMLADEKGASYEVPETRMQRTQGHAFTPTCPLLCSALGLPNARSGSDVSCFVCVSCVVRCLHACNAGGCSTLPTF